MLGRNAALALSLAFSSTAFASSLEACDAKGTTCDAAKGSAMLQVKFEETHGMEAVGKHGARRSCVSTKLQKASQIARAKNGDECRGNGLPLGTACTKQGVEGRCAKITGGQATDATWVGGPVPIFCDIGQYAACEGSCEVVSLGRADCSGWGCQLSNWGSRDVFPGRCEQTGTTGLVSGNQPIIECKIADQEPTTKPDPEPTTKPEKPVTEAPTTAAPEEPKPGRGVGGTAPLDAAGFRAVTSFCCPMETESFFNRLLDKAGYHVCSKPHIQGLMHWFSCVPDMDFKYVLDVIANGNPCKYWSPKGIDCPVLSAACRGEWCR